MLEEQQKRVQRAITSLIDDVYKTHLKEIQKQMHNCASNCCDDRRGNIESVQQCIELCAKPMIKAQDHLQHELGQFQGRLQNCVMECGDDARKYLPPSPGDSDMKKYRFHFDRCAVKCVDTHLSLIPAMMKSIRSVLEKGAPNKRPF